ncbi:MAG: putative peptidoglycan glycosyltransferase FtsW [Opitutales bacterium]
MAKKKAEHFGFFSSWITVLIPVIFLTGLGLLTLISAASYAENTLMFFDKQAKWLVLAVLMSIGAAFINLEILKKCFWVFLLLSIPLLIVVLIPQLVEPINGARRWIKIGSYTIQPSEFSKIALVITMAFYLQKNQRYIKTFWRGLIFPLCIFGMFSALIILEPDYGTSVLCAIVGLSLLFLAGTKFIYLVGTCILGFLGLAVMIFLNPVRWARLISFTDVEANKLEGTYQLNQALTGFGAGGISGAGLGQGSQQQYFLPEAHTDFIFAIVGEELGLLMTLSVVFAFFFLFVYVCTKLKYAQNLFELYLAIGAMLMIVMQSIFNMGVVTGLFPTKGISLPFVSYGGSNLVVMFVFVGLILNCLRSWRNPQQIKAKEL